MDDFKSIEGWKKLWRWCWNHGLVALIIIAAYISMSSNGWLAPSVRFATAQEVVEIQQQILAQNSNYERINQALIEIKIGQHEALLRDMLRDADARTSAGQQVPPWLEDQIRETRRRIEILKQENNR